MNVFHIASRNVLRNRRRSAATLATMVIGAMAIILFGGFVIRLLTAFGAGFVQRTGHLQIYHEGYFLYGAGNPAEYGIDHYEALRARLRDDPVLKPMLRLVTLQQSVGGIAGNFTAGTSKPFFGLGVVPSEYARLEQWVPPDIPPWRIPMKIYDDRPELGSIGSGLARILGLCQLVTGECRRVAQTAKVPVSEEGRGMMDLATAEAGPKAVAGSVMPMIDLLAATAGGAPNVVSLQVSEAPLRGQRELDDNLVVMNLSLAQQLVYGRGQRRVTAVVVLLDRMEDLSLAKARIAQLISGQPLEVRDFKELAPQYQQTVGMLATIFCFIAAIMGIVVLFSVTSTLAMAVAERTAEIGTLRALGLKRQGVRRLFLAEGVLLGILGASAGIAVAFVAAALINRAGLSWTPPGNVTPVSLQIFVVQYPILPIATWGVMVLLASLSAWLPARRAARMEVVDALRHV